MAAWYILLASVFLQSAAAVKAFLLIRSSGRRLAWILIVVAMVLIIGRRIVNLWNSWGNPAPVWERATLEAGLNFALSACMLAGVWLIGPMFHAFARAHGKLKVSEAAARRQAEELEMVYQHSPVGLAVLDRQLRYIRINEMLATMNGRAVQDCRGRTVFEAFPEIAPRVVEVLGHVLKTGLPMQNVEINDITLANGSQVSRLASYFPLRSEQGEVVGVMVAVLETTARRRAEKELEQYRKHLEELVAQRTAELDRTIAQLQREAAAREQTQVSLAQSESRYRTLFELSPVALWENDFSGIQAELNRLQSVKDWGAYFREHPEELSKILCQVRVLSVNHTTLAMYGANSQEELVAHLSKVLRPETALQFALDIECFAGGKESCAYEIEGRDVQGRRRVFFVHWAVVERRPDLVRVLVSQEDITRIKEAQEAMRTLTQKLLTVREEERRRVASDLHDSLAQGLVALKLAVHAAKVPPAVEQCDGLIQEVRQICHGLYPPVLERLGLAAALQQLCGGYDSQPEVSLQFPPELRNARLGNEVEIMLFRIAQEAINNAVRHGLAKRVRLLLETEDSRLRLSVQDDGKGFDVAGAGTGLGLLTMKDRATVIGGTLELTSQPGQTTVLATVPMQTQA